MEEMPITLHGSQSLVLGFGRVGKMTAKMLDGMGSNVHVEAESIRILHGSEAMATGLCL